MKVAPSLQRLTSARQVKISNHTMIVPSPAGGGGGGAGEGRGVLPEKLGGGVQPASQNPYPIYDQNLRYSLPYL